MRVLVTGSRDWSDDRTLFSALNTTLLEWRAGGGGHSPEDTFVVVHGGARGADILADEWARDLGPSIGREAHLADWERYGTAAGHKRNQEMLDTGIDLVLAFQWSEKSPGTKGCVRMAKRMGIPVKHFQPKLW